VRENSRTRANVYSKHRPKHENQPETNSNAANINTRNTIVSIVSPCSRVNENSARGFPQILLLPPTALSTFRAQKKTPPRKASPSDHRDERIARTFERSRNRSSNEGRCGERKHVARVYVLTRAPLLIYDDDDDNDDDDGRLFGIWRLGAKNKKKEIWTFAGEKETQNSKIMRAYTSHLTFVFAARRASTSYATTSTSTSSSTSPGVASRGRSKTSVRTYAFTPSSSASATSATSTYSSSSSSSSPVKNNYYNGNNKKSSKVVANARKGMLFNSEMDDIRRDAKPAEPVKFTLPLSIKLYPSKCLRAKNEPVTVFDDNLKELSKEMFKIMYETVGCGLAAPQVGVNYRLMVYNEAGAPGEGKEVVLVNPKISKFSKQKDFFEEGCLSFPKIYAEVEVRLMIFSSFLSIHFLLFVFAFAHKSCMYIWKTKNADERSKHEYTLIRVSFNKRLCGEM